VVEKLRFLGPVGLEYRGLSIVIKLDIKIDLKLILRPPIDPQGPNCL